MKKSLFVIFAVLCLWVSSSYILYSPEDMVVSPSKSIEAIAVAPVSTSTSIIAAATTSIATTTAVVAAKPVVTASPAATPATAAPKKISGTMYTDPVGSFSFTLPTGWASLVEKDTSSSTRLVYFSTAAEIDKDIPEPLLSIKIVRLDKKDAADYEENKAMLELINDLGTDGFINWTIDNVMKKEYNALEIKSLNKKTIDGKLFYVIDSQYIGEESFKDVRFISYIYASQSSLLVASAYTYAENIPLYKDLLLGAMNTIKIW